MGSSHSGRGARTGVGAKAREDVELALQVVGLEQPGRRRADADDDVSPLVPAGRVQHSVTRRVSAEWPPVQAIEPLNPNVVGIGQLRGEPRRQATLEVHQPGTKRMRMRS